MASKKKTAEETAPEETAALTIQPSAHVSTEVFDFGEDAGDGLQDVGSDEVKTWTTRKRLRP